MIGRALLFRAGGGAGLIGVVTGANFTAGVSASEALTLVAYNAATSTVHAPESCSSI